MKWRFYWRQELIQMFKIRLQLKIGILFYMTRAKKKSRVEDKVEKDGG